MDAEKLYERCDDHSSTSSTPLVGDSECAETPPRKLRYSSYIHWGLHILSLGIICALAAIQNQPSRARCWDQFNTYSPLREFVAQHPYETKLINGSKSYRSEFTGPPTEKHGKVWRGAMKYGLLSLQEDEMAKLGFPSSSAQFPSAEVAGGGYPVVVVGHHQLHCLHYLWQDHHLDYYDGRRRFRETHLEIYEKHYDHCVDFLRQRIMCQYDMSVTPYEWVQDVQAPLLVAPTTEKCVDWSAMQAWMQRHEPDVPLDFIWKVPDDAVVFDAPP